MHEKIVAENKEHLKCLIKEHIDKYGEQCNLNHIEVTNVTDMSSLFEDSLFNGDISKWDVSNVINMSYMFEYSKFNGDLSLWDVSNVTNMQAMFEKSKFNGCITQWNVSNVQNMLLMFYGAQFRGDISHWNIHDHCSVNNMFNYCVYPTDGILFWYFVLDGRITELNESQSEHLKLLKPLLDCNLDNIVEAKYLNYLYNQSQIQKIIHIEL